MNKLSLLTVVGAIALTGPAFAATQAQTDADIEVLRSAIKTERQSVVAANMELADTESQNFWKVYNEYQVEQKANRDRTTQLIVNFVKNRATMSDKDASKLMKDWLSTEKEEISLKDKYMKKFGKFLPASKVARYFQIENKLDAVIRLDLAQEIPLVMTAKTTEPAKK